MFLARLSLLLVIPLFLNAQTAKDGRELVKKGNYAEAKQLFEQLIKTDEKNAEAHYNLARLYLIQGFEDYYDKAVDEMEKAVELEPNNAEYQYFYGAALGVKTQNSGILKQAFLASKVKKAFARAVELDPKHFRARVSLAQYYLQAPGFMGGDEEEGWRQLDEAVKLDELQGRTVRAGILQAKGKSAEAEKEWQKLISSHPKDWQVWKGKAYFHYRGKNYDEAISHFKKYVELRPDTADSWESLAEGQLAKGEADQAITNLKKALSIDKSFAAAVYYLGEAYQKKGLKKEAIESYQAVLVMPANGGYGELAEKKLKELQ